MVDRLFSDPALAADTLEVRRLHIGELTIDSGIPR
jgi:hypothetical protein